MLIAVGDIRGIGGLLDREFENPFSYNVASRSWEMQGWILHGVAEYLSVEDNRACT